MRNQIVTTTTTATRRRTAIGGIVAGLLSGALAVSALLAGASLAVADGSSQSNVTYGYVDFYDVPRLGHETVVGTGCGGDGSVGTVIPDGYWRGYVTASDPDTAIELDLTCVYHGDIDPDLISRWRAQHPGQLEPWTPDGFVVNNSSRTRTVPVASTVVFHGTQFGTDGSCRFDQPDTPYEIGEDSWVRIVNGQAHWVVSGCSTPGEIGPWTGSYTVVSGDTLSGIAGRAGVPLAELIAVNGWSDGADHTILPGDVIAFPAGATEPTPRPTDPTDDNSGSSGNSGSREGGYAPTESRDSGGDTLAITHPLADGVYGAEATSDGTNIAFLLGRYISFGSCAEGLTVDEAATACASPPLWEDGDGTTISVVGSDLDRATVLAVFGFGGQSLSVDGAELARLIAGQAPAADAPADFRFATSYSGYRITVEHGEVVAADQQFHS